MSPELTARFVQIAGYWIQPKDIETTIPGGVRLLSGRTITEGTA